MTPEEIRQAQLDELRRQIDRNRRIAANARSVYDAAQHGVVFQDEFKTAVNARVATMQMPGSNTPPPIDLDAVDGRLKVLAKQAGQRLAVIKEGPQGVLGGIYEGGRALLGGLAKGIGYTGAQLLSIPGLAMGAMGSAGSMLPGADLSAPEIGSLGSFGSAYKASGDILHGIDDAVETRLFNLPVDPLARQLYKNQYPVTTNMADFTGKVIGAGLTMPSVQSLAATFPRLAPLLTLMPAPTIRGALAPAVVGGAMGWGGHMLLGAEKPGAMDDIEAVMAGIGGGLALSTILRGVPTGIAARGYFTAERAALGAMSPANLALPWKFHPRLTLGRLLESGALGANVTATEAMNQGADPLTAVQQGVMAGLSWMGQDIAVARIGGLARWAAINTAFQQRAAIYLQEMQGWSAVKASGAAGTAQVAFNVGVPAVAGAALDAMQGDDPVWDGAAWAATIAGGGWSVLQQRMLNARTLLPEPLVLKVLSGDFGRLTREEAGDFAQFMTTDLTRNALRDYAITDARTAALGRADRVSAGDEALHEFGEVLLGKSHTIDPREYPLVSELAQLRTQLLPFEERGVLLPQEAALVTQLEARVFTIREQLAKFYAQAEVRAFPNPLPVPQPQAGAVTALEGSLVRDALEGTTNTAQLWHDMLQASPQELQAASLRALKIKPGGIARPVESLRDLEVALGERGLDLKEIAPSREGLRRWEVHTPDGVMIASGTSLHGLRAQVDRILTLDMPETRFVGGAGTLADLRPSELTGGPVAIAGAGAPPVAAAQLASPRPAPLVRLGERGASTPAPLVGLAGLISGGLLGSVTGAVASKFGLDLDGSDDGTAEAVLGGVLGAFGLSILAAKASGLHVNPQMTKAVQQWIPKGADEISSAEVERIVGRTTYTANGVKKPVTKAVFFRLPAEAQGRHLSTLLDKVAGTQNVEHEALKAKFHNLLRVYTPSYITPAALTKLEQQVPALAQRIGYTEEQAYGLWRGFLHNSTISPALRIGRQHLDLLSMGRDASRLGGAEGYEALRKVMSTAEVITGFDGPQPAGHSAAWRANAKNSMLTPRANTLKEIAFIADKSDIKLRGQSPAETGTILGLPILSSLRPPEWMRAAGARLHASGDAVGARILAFHDGLTTATRTIKTETASHMVELHKIYQGMDLEARRYVARIMRDPAERELARVSNERAYTAAIKTKELMDSVAARVFGDDWRTVTKDFAIEDYFPYYYSPRTMRELRSSGVVPDDFFVPHGTGISEYKFFRSMVKRKSGDPLGAIIDDPLEAGRIYVTGGIRKIHFDPMLARFDKRFFKDLSRSQPWITADLARWFMDTLGVPSAGRMRALSSIRNIGIELEKMHWFNSSELGQDIIDRYFFNPRAGDKFANMALGWTFVTKLGGSMISALVNLGQLVNTATDHSTSSIVLGGIPFMFQTTAAKLAEKVPLMSPFIPGAAAGKAKLAFSRQYGVNSDATLALLNRFEARATEETRTVGRALGAGLVGGVAGLFIGGDDVTAQQPGLSAAAGTAAYLVAPKYVARALRLLPATLLAPFHSVEIINRNTTFGSATWEAARAQKLTAAGRTGKATDVLESTLLGGAVGAGAGAVSAPEGERGERALKYGVGGALAGAAIGAQGESRASRVVRDLDAIKAGKKLAPQSMLDLVGAEPTLEEVSRWYGRQATDITQFIHSSSARPAALRTTGGAVLGALQGFTLNQAEFVGQRMASFVRSGGSDTRIFRHMLLLLGTGAALAAMSSTLDSDKGTTYWMSRIGFGLVPFVRWNEPAQEWQLEDITTQLGGPFVRDVLAGTRFFHKILTDPQAQDAWHLQADRLARQWVAALRQLGTYPEGLAAGANKLGQEGLADYIMEQQQRVSNVAYPGSAVRGQPRRESSSGGAPGGISGGGFSGGGFSGGGFQGGGGL